ncbi:MULTISPECIES: DUF4129 domain-containing protein [Haloferax]|uniref:DUF4129 domain-containing protein n=1 Tax=Haloferax marinum TaxID=2666143 RepID=A0A6A8G6B9_9EURY|nr:MULTISPECIES: DUF4129 domain-containing protein [Haloferax]KAB1197145.1 DUF4129 domain-containing protein [Haloferax sp. CBA1150]MRW96178.1 DUF4129 domain-containing protein [Haloferax marinum]
MDRSTLGALALALLAVVAFAVAAATIDSTVVTDGGPAGFGAGSAGGGGVGETEDTGFEPLSGDTEGISIPTPCLPWLFSPEVLGIVAAAFLLVAGYAYWETKSLLPPVAVVLALGPPVVLLFGLLTACNRGFSFSTRAAAAAGNISLFAPGGGGRLGEGAGGIQSVSPPTILFSILLVVALVVALFMLVAGTSDTPDADDESANPSLEGESNVAAVGRAAGAAAERIESGETDVENEVFRAWAEMTALLDVPNRQSATPAEFAAAAVDAGMARDDVTELTDLFEVVRYGGAEATAERERRAVDALRNIESVYAPPEQGADTGQGTTTDRGTDTRQGTHTDRRTTTDRGTHTDRETHTGQEGR